LEFARRNTRRGVAGIVATVIMFAILFTVGTSYFIFVSSQNSSYVSSLLSATNKVQGNLAEGLSIGTLLDSTGNVEFYANNTSSETINMTAVLVISSTGTLLSCEGVGFPAGAGCTNSTPALWRVVNPGSGSPAIDTEYTYVAGTTLTIKVLTARGNSYSATYPEPASQSTSSQSVTVSLDNLKWVQLIPQASSLVQKNFVANCNSSSCAASYNSGVAAGNILVDAVSWPNQAPPSSVPSDTLHDSFTLGASASVAVPSSPALVQHKYTSNCNAANCGLAFSSNVGSGNTLVYALGWANQSPPSTPTDTRGDSFTLGASQSLTVNPPTPALVQSRYNSNCNSATCALAYSSPVTAGNTLVFGLGWYGTAQYVPITVSNCVVPLTLGLDGANYNTGTGSTLSASLTTSNTNDVIIAVAAGQNSATGTYQTPSISDSSGLSWSPRSTLQEVSSVGGFSYYGEIFYAIAASALSGDSIKITWNSAPTQYGTLQVFGVSGANTSNPFDSGSGLPSFATRAYASVTTSNPNDFIYGAELTASTGSPSAGSGFSGIESNVGGNLASEYEVVSAAQSGLSVSFSNAGSDADGSWGDAIVRGGGCASSALSFDGSTGANTESNSVSASLTTSNSNDVIVLSAGTSSSSTSVSSVSDTGGHTWTHRSTETGSTTVEMEEWYTTASSPLSSDSITVTWSASGDNTFEAFGISGANTAGPFDTNGGLPAKTTGTGGSPSVSVSTSNANDMVFGLLVNEHTSANICHTETVGSGFTDTGAAQSCASGSNTSQNSDQEYEIVSSTQTNLAIPFTTSSGGSNQWVMIGDAVVAATGSATPSTFQQMVTWNPSAYSTYEASNLGNIRFCADSACASPLDAWLESCSSTCGPSNTSATAWVKLTSSIAAGGSTTIYMVFEATSVNFDDNYWGEAPTLSGTYGQYDNGANVFEFYSNFAGSSLPAAFSTKTNSGSYTVNNGLTLHAGNTQWIHVYTTATHSSGVVETSLVSLTSSAELAVAAETSAPASGGDLGFQTGYRGQDSPIYSDVNIVKDVSGTGTSLGTATPQVSSGIIGLEWSTTGTENLYVAYTNKVSASDSAVTYGASHLDLFFYGGASSQSGVVNWFRNRADPPNGLMPLTSFGSVTTGNGSPSGPTDTLGDTFTLGVSNTITVSNLNYYSYIWYTTAASSGSDTITATFGSAVTGSISIYELAGYTTVGPLSSTGSSAGGSTSLSVTSFTPTTNSFVIGNAETSSSTSTFTAGSNYNLISTCSSVYGCSEYLSGSNGARTVQMSLGASAPWVESAISFAPLQTNTYYSYIWYATAGSSGADTISATFSQTVAGSVSIYEISGVTATGLLSSTGSSSTSQSSSSVTSITPNAGSVVVGNTETTSTTFTAGTGYTLSGTCSSVLGCGEYQTGVGSPTTVPMSFSSSGPWVETALGFAPIITNYYSYIWYATAATSGSDTITATFGASVTGSVSIYEVTGYTTSGALSSTGSSITSSTTSGVTSYTPATDSFTVGAVESPTSVQYTAGSGFTLVGTCNPVYGCSEYNAGGGGSASTVPMTLGTSAPWVEASISFSTPFNQQSGIQVNGYPTMGVASGASLAWEVTFTNVDPQHRAITIWPQTEMAIGSAEYDGFDTDYTQAHYFIIDGLNAGSTTVTGYTKTSGTFLTLAYNVPTTLYFAATVALGSTTQAFGTNVLTPFEAYFALTGIFSDGTLFGETIPYPYGIITQANAYTTPTTGATGNTVTVSCTSPCHFTANAKAMVGWINSAGQITQLTTFTMSGSGNIPSGVTFQVPAAAAGYYTIEVTDYINSVFMTFQHT
jgi:hypothetical protein